MIYLWNTGQFTGDCGFVLMAAESVEDAWQKLRNSLPREWFKLKTGRCTYMVFETNADFDRIVEKDTIENGAPERGYPMEPVEYTADTCSYPQW